MATTNIIYSDVDMNFTINSEGDVDVLTNIEAVRQSIKNIILTPRKHRTRYQDPDYGCGVFNLLFEKMSSITEILILITNLFFHYRISSR